MFGIAPQASESLSSPLTNVDVVFGTRLFRYRRQRSAYNTTLPRNDDMGIGRLIDFGNYLLPVVLGVLFIAFPQWFTKKDLKVDENKPIASNLRKAGWLLIAAGGILIASFGVFGALGDRMNQNQLLGCLTGWAFLVVWAVFVWWVGTWRVRPRLATEPHFRLWFAVGTGALVFAIVQVPLWGLMTHRFPPDKFTVGQSILATIGVVFGLFAPGAPLVARVLKSIWQTNQEQRRKLKEKKPGASQQSEGPRH